VNGGDLHVAAFLGLYFGGYAGECKRFWCAMNVLNERREWWRWKPSGDGSDLEGR